MGFIWFWIVAVMIAAYVVLDGFDIGVGILYPFLGRTDQDKLVMMRSIGPVWDGNEVWLLIGRGISIELRAHIDNAVWRSFFDGLFFLSSALLAIFLGAALANVVRGVPIGPDQYFFLPLWTNWQVGPHPGILDWYTVIGGLVAFIALATHGALYLATKASGDLEIRTQKVAQTLWLALCAITAVSLAATMMVRHSTLDNYTAHPILFAIPLLVLLSLTGIKLYASRKQNMKAFLSSCLYLTIMLVGACVGLYPVVLPSSAAAADDITIAKSLSGTYATHVGLLWWAFGMVLAIGYFCVSYGTFRGKVSDDPAGYGH